MNVKKLLHLVCCGFMLLLMGSCQEQSNDAKYGITSYDELYVQLEELQELLDSSIFGDNDNEYPAASAVILLDAIDAIEQAIILAKTNQLMLQMEVDAYVAAAQQSITQFKNSINAAVEVGTPAELRVAGTEGGNIQFAKGTGDAADFDAGSSDFSSGTQWTIELWFKFSSDYAGDIISDVVSTFSNTNNDYQGWCINFMSSKLRTSVGFGTSANLLEPGTSSASYDTWHHIAVVYDPNEVDSKNVIFYLNGTQAETSAANGDYKPNGEDYRMWAFQRPTNSGHCSTGYIKKFRKWEVALSSSQIVEVMERDVTSDDVSGGLMFAWDFTSPTEDNEAIVDITGRYTAKLTGSYKWWPIE